MCGAYICVYICIGALYVCVCVTLAVDLFKTGCRQITSVFAQTRQLLFSTLKLDSKKEKAIV